MRFLAGMSARSYTQIHIHMNTVPECSGTIYIYIILQTYKIENERRKNKILPIYNYRENHTYIFMYMRMYVYVCAWVHKYTYIYVCWCMCEEMHIILFRFSTIFNASCWLRHSGIRCGFTYILFYIGGIFFLTCDFPCRYVLMDFFSLHLTPHHQIRLVRGHCPSVSHILSSRRIIVII